MSEQGLKLFQWVFVHISKQVLSMSLVDCERFNTHSRILLPWKPAFPISSNAAFLPQPKANPDGALSCFHPTPSPPPHIYLDWQQVSEER